MQGRLNATEQTFTCRWNFRDNYQLQLSVLIKAVRPTHVYTNALSNHVLQHAIPRLDRHFLGVLHFH